MIGQGLLKQQEAARNWQLLYFFLRVSRKCAMSQRLKSILLCVTAFAGYLNFILTALPALLQFYWAVFVDASATDQAPFARYLPAVSSRHHCYRAHDR